MSLYQTIKQDLINYTEDGFYKTNIDNIVFQSVNKLNNWFLGIPSAIIVILIVNYDKLLVDNYLSKWFILAIIIISGGLLYLYGYIRIKLLLNEVKFNTIDKH